MSDFVFGEDWSEPFIEVQSVPEELLLTVTRVDTHSFYNQPHALSFTVDSIKRLRKLHKKAVEMVERGLFDWAPGARNDIEV